MAGLNVAELLIYEETMEINWKLLMGSEVDFSGAMQ